MKKGLETSHDFLRLCKRAKRKLDRLKLARKNVSRSRDTVEFKIMRELTQRLSNQSKKARDNKIPVADLKAQYKKKGKEGLNTF
jgi:hypothetical protein